MTLTNASLASSLLASYYPLTLTSPLRKNIMPPHTHIVVVTSTMSSTNQAESSPSTSAQTPSSNQVLLGVQSDRPYTTVLSYVIEFVAEMVGTFILVFSICGINASVQIEGSGRVALLEYAVTAGAAVVVAAFTCGPISGGHINPSITIAFAVFGHFPLHKVVVYVVAQVGGAALATYVGVVVYGIKPEVMVTVPFEGSAAAFWAEFIATLILTFLVASLAKNLKTVGELMGLVMGVAILLAVLITGPVSGGSLNPARSLGPAMVANKFSHIWVYLVAPTLGAVAGVGMVHALCLQARSSSTSTTPPIPH